MKKALLVLAAGATVASTSAQSVVFKNRNIATSQPDSTLPNYIAGGNNNGSYNVPIKAADGSPAGTLPGGVIVGIFTDVGTTPLATTILGTTAQLGSFFATPSSADVDTGAAPGSRPTLVIREWQGTTLTFAQAKAAGNQWAEQTFQSPPVSGAGSPPGPAPTLTGWGPVDGSGITLTPEPSTIALGALGIGALLIRRRK